LLRARSKHYMHVLRSYFSILILPIPFSHTYSFSIILANPHAATPDPDPGSQRMEFKQCGQGPIDF